ncbi:hypothetical protein PLICRDRAFT_45879 [Plicaturopsis crispa FD-325 SS-3]|uniref:Uncharacterized protein n=1 Tax=Plicaturopsis crispa FD-325 SS-3 TaxID=944288 RepID=A0A0C9T8I7_PLICR|nr:hypothetical protein PLICRDRAFT_45879 [Plicaturopsis crispa FD-325 SS-3]
MGWSFVSRSCALLVHGGRCTDGDSSLWSMYPSSDKGVLSSPRRCVSTLTLRRMRLTEVVQRGSEGCCAHLEGLISEVCITTLPPTVFYDQSIRPRYLESIDCHIHAHALGCAPPPPDRDPLWLFTRDPDNVNANIRREIRM